MTLDQWQEAFRKDPSHENAIKYLRAILEYEGDEMIGEDTFRSALDEIATGSTYK